MCGMRASGREHCSTAASRRPCVSSNCLQRHQAPQRTSHCPDARSILAMSYRISHLTLSRTQHWESVHTLTKDRREC